MIPLDPLIAQRAAADPSASVWVAASAGTGKTKVLTDRVLALLLAGTKPSRILCLTFTRAAAAEMSIRIADRLGDWAAWGEAKLIEDLTELLGVAPDAQTCGRARRLFVEVLDAPGGLAILTIHAFGQALLRRFPLEAGLAPHFAVMDERDARELLNGAVDEVLAAARAGDGEAVAALAILSGHVHESNFPDLIGELITERVRLGRMLNRLGGTPAAVARLASRLGLTAEATPGRVVAAATGGADEAALRRVVRALAKGKKSDQERAAVIAAWLAADDVARIAGFDDYVSAFLTDEGEVRKRLVTSDLDKADSELLPILSTEAERLRAVRERCRAAVTLEATAALIRLGESFLDAYQRAKQRRALLDYDDLIDAARDLLRKPGVAPWVLYKLDGGIDHILIDEAQDTNPEQWEVVEALAEEFFSGQGAREERRTVFAVGDAKQSIYSFQRADPAAFERMRHHFARKVPEAGQTWRPVELNVSFRSTRAVLEAVDAVFNQAPACVGVATGGGTVSHVSWRPGEGGSVELWPVVESRGDVESEPWKPPVERLRPDAPRARLAALLASRIAAMIENGEELPSKGRPIQPGDILVLVRRRDALVEDLVRELKARHIAVAGVDRMVLPEQLAVQDLIALGRFLLLPEDDLTLACVLKSPLVGLSEEDLFDLAYDRPGHLWAELGRRASERPQFALARAELSDLLARADRAPPFEFYADLLGPRGGRRKIVARLGAEAEDALDEFLDQALAFERAHVPSLEGFLFWLERGGVEVKRDLETARRGALRIMTVHGAKGLQAPIVILPDTVQVPRQGPKLLWPNDGHGELLLWPPLKEHREVIAEAEFARRKDLADQEYRRLLYVAMTRAEDRLIVCGWRGRSRSENSWHDLVRQGMATLTAPVADSFLERAGGTGGAEILRHACAQTRDPKHDERGGTATLEAGPLPDWGLSPPDPEPRPPRPLAPSRPDDEPTVRSPLDDDDGLRFRRGRLLHRLLQSLPDLPLDERGAAARRWLDRAAGDLDDTVREALVTEVLAVMALPEAAAVFSSQSQAEVPVVGALGPHAVSGQVDRLAVTAETVWVVDYKTNRPPPERVEAVAAVYLRQMAVYRAVLRGIFPNRTIRCALLWTDRPRWMALPDSLLDAHAP